MTGTLAKTYRAGLLSSFIFISYVTMASSLTLDLTELRNKISKIKVNPRGNLWATGHFMGKKSVVDNSLLDSLFGDVNVPAEDVNPEDLQGFLIEMLKAAQGREMQGINRGDAA